MLIFHVGCCTKVRVGSAEIHSNAIYEELSTYFGSYTLAPNLFNGKPQWISENGKNLIWFHKPKFWFIGATSNRAKKSKPKAYAISQELCVHNVSYAWNYGIEIGNGVKWQQANEGFGVFCETSK